MEQSTSQPIVYFENITEITPQMIATMWKVVYRSKWILYYVIGALFLLDALWNCIRMVQMGDMPHPLIFTITLLLVIFAILFFWLPHRLIRQGAEKWQERMNIMNLGKNYVNQYRFLSETIAAKDVSDQPEKERQIAYSAIQKVSADAANIFLTIPSVGTFIIARTAFTFGDQAMFVQFLKDKLPYARGISKLQ